MNNLYKVVWVKGKGRRYEHRLVWEAAHGEIPADSQIHHIDGDPRNNAPENLELVPKSLHTRRHQRGKKHTGWAYPKLDESYLLARAESRHCETCGKEIKYVLRRGYRGWKGKCDECWRRVRRK